MPTQYALACWPDGNRQTGAPLVARRPVQTIDEHSFDNAFYVYQFRRVGRQRVRIKRRTSEAPTCRNFRYIAILLGGFLLAWVSDRGSRP